MPYLTLNGVRLYYEERGTGPETIVFAHGLLWSGRMFDRQVAALQAHFRCITFDFRGQGQSQVTASGYDMDTLTEDAAALIAALGCAPCHFVGLSMGGFVGMRLALRHPHRIRSLVLMETSADPEPKENIGRYRLLNFIARWFGWRRVVGRIMPILFGQKFLNDPARAPLRETMKAALLRNHRAGLTRAVTGVIERAGVDEDLHQIRIPTLGHRRRSGCRDGPGPGRAHPCANPGVAPGDHPRRRPYLDGGRTRGRQSDAAGISRARAWPEPVRSI